MTDPKPLKAYWPNGPRVLAGTDAQAFLRDSASRLGEDPDTILDVLEADTPSNRIAVAALGLTREALYFKHRPPDTIRAQLIMRVVDDLMWRRDLKFSEACKAAPAYLADPRKRVRDQIGRGSGSLGGNGSFPRDMSPDAVRNAYRKARQTLLPGWFFEEIDAPEDALPAAR